MKNPLTFYSKLNKRVIGSAEKLQKLLETGKFDVDNVMREYFGKYWPEFCKFWKQRGETPEWVTFALAPHNGVMFIQYVFSQYPEVLERVEKDMAKF